jgi:predicted ATP-grasp superfamily ATP-dependent carboligase
MRASGRILLTDGDERATLAAARSLVAAGCEVHVIAPQRRSLAGSSHGVHAHIVSSDPLTAPDAYAQAVFALTRQLSIDVLLPVTDGALEPILHASASRPPATALPSPSLESYRIASDKVATLGLARDAGLAVPPTVIVTDGKAPRPPVPADWFPVVLKPHRSVVIEPGGTRRRVGVEFARSATELTAKLDQLPAAAFPVAVQRRVVGEGEGLFLLRWNGRTVAAFAHRRLREKPPWGGVSVYRESIQPPPPLLAAGERLLTALGWQGVAMIECKRDLATGEHVLMEINGRLWGSLQLALDAGVDFPALLVRCARGEVVHGPAPYRTGIRSRWFWGDVDHLYLRLRRPDADLPPGLPPTRLGALLQFFAMRPGRDRFEIFRWSDPVPFLLESWRRLAGQPTGR